MIKISILLLLNFLSLSKNNQPEQEIKDFYKWYLNGGREEVQPSFKRTENGFTTLNIKEIETILEQKNVSKHLLEKYHNKWTDCQTNLSKLHYEDFQAIDDISGIEDLMCDVQSDFWFAESFENPNEFKLEKGEYIDENKYKAEISVSSALLKFQVIMIKKNGKWLLYDIK